MFFYFVREKQSAISKTYGNNMRMRVTHRFENRCTCIQYVRSVYHPESTKRLIVGIIRTVTEAHESHLLLADLRRVLFLPQLNNYIRESKHLSILKNIV